MSQFSSLLTAALYEKEVIEIVDSDDDEDEDEDDGTFFACESEEKPIFGVEEEETDEGVSGQLYHYPTSSGENSSNESEEIYKNSNKRKRRDLDIENEDEQNDSEGSISDSSTLSDDSSYRPFKKAKIQSDLSCKSFVRPEFSLQPCLYKDPPTSQREEMDEIERKVWGWTIEQEKDYLPNPNYLSKHPDLPPTFRYILFDWIFEVAQEFKLHRETAHLTCNYIDRYLSASTKTKKNQLQLLGVTSLFIASKLEEIYPPNAKDFCAVTDGLYTIEDIHSMELDILKKLRWRLLPPTLNFWVNFYLQNISRVIGPQCDEEILKTTKDLKHFYGPKFLSPIYLKIMSLVDCCIHDTGSFQFSYSLMAASAIDLLINEQQQKQLVYKASGFSLKQITECKSWLKQFLNYPGVGCRGETIHVNVSPVDRCNIQTHNQNFLPHCMKDWE